jgi:hypothetical protein
MNVAFGQHIISLLKEHECVVLPNIGGLLLKRVAAHSSKGQIYPSSKIIRFNRNITTDAELLVSSLINFQGLSYIEAKQEVQNFVGRIKFQLTQNGFCDIDTLGRFSLTEEDHVKFIANASIKNLDKENYGFNSLHAFPIHRVIIEDKKTVETKVVELVPEFTTVRKIRKTALIGLVATFAMIIGIFSLITTNTTVDSFKVQDANVLNFLMPKSSSFTKQAGSIRYKESANSNKVKKGKKTESKRKGQADSEELNTNRGLVNKISVEGDELSINTVESAGLSSNALMKDILKVNNDHNPKGYYIVTGSFGSMANVNKAKYKCSMDNSCQVFKTKSGMYRVAIYASTNAQSALGLVAELKKENSSYWLIENH